MSAVRSGVVTLGETMLLLGAGSPLLDADTVEVGTGGAESNVAIALAHLGVPVTWVGRVGDDPAGERVLADVRAQGVDVRATVDPVRSTGLMMKDRLHDGRTRVTYHRRGSAGAALEPADVPAGLVEASRVLHVSGITLALGDPARTTLLDAVERAVRAGVPVSFDVNHRPKLIDDAAGRALYRAVAARSAIVFAGDDEARLVLDRPGPVSGPGSGPDADDAASLALGLADLANGRAVVKLGSRGAVAAIDGRIVHRPATPVTVVDPVGAGDAFVAAYLAARLDGDDPVTALDRAADAGALACTVPGDWHQLPGSALDGARTDTVTAGPHDHVDR